MDGTRLAPGLDFVIPGLRYISGYLEPAAHDALLAAVDAGEWRDFGERRAQIYGYSYHYTKGGIYRVEDLPRGRRTSPHASSATGSCRSSPTS